MSITDFKTVLDYCAAENINFLFIQGGEPTAHSNFREIIRLLNNRGFKYTLFTNGVFDTSLIKELLPAQDNEILLNYNKPDTYIAPGDWDLVNRNIEEIISKGINFKLGYTMYENKPDYAFFLNAIEKYGLRKIRWDLARPSRKFTNKFFDFKGFFEMKTALAGFLKEIIARGCYCEWDCPLPACMFLSEDFDFINYKIDLTSHSNCGAMINIGAGLRISGCPAGMDFRDIYLTDFQSLSQAQLFLDAEFDSIRNKIWLSDDCTDCIYRYAGECQGGCIGHKRMRGDKIIGKTDLKKFLETSSSSAGYPQNNKMSIRIDENILNNAVAKYSSMLEKDMENPFLLFSLGRCYEYLELYDNAILCYEKIKRAHAGYLIAGYRLDLVYQLKAIQTNKKNIRAWQRLRDICANIFENPEIFKNYVRRYSFDGMFGAGSRQGVINVDREKK